MDWIILKGNEPKEKGVYMCFVPDCRYYNEHCAEYKWDGDSFVDNQPYIGSGRVVEATHYFKVIKPDLDDKN